MIEAHGGSLGLRDLGALESALFRPQSGYYADIVAEACALLESLAINHPFVDGNKRTAFVAAELFMVLNGWQLNAPDEACVMVMLSLAGGEIDEGGFAHWLRVNAARG